MDVFLTYWRLPNLITYRAGCTALNKDRQVFFWAFEGAEASSTAWGGKKKKKKLLRFQRRKPHLKCTLECVIWKMQHTCECELQLRRCCPEAKAWRKEAREAELTSSVRMNACSGSTSDDRVSPTRLAQMSWVTAICSAGVVNERVPPSVGTNWECCGSEDVDLICCAESRRSWRKISGYSSRATRTNGPWLSTCLPSADNSESQDGATNDVLSQTDSKFYDW